MDLPATVESYQGLDLGGKALHLAIGMFDGLHLGHQAVIDAAIHAATATASDGKPEGVSGVLTFWPHPSRIISPQNPVRQIMMPQIKSQFLHELGVRLVIQKRFDSELAKTEAEDFLPGLKKVLPTLKSIYVGQNYRFGRGRKGDLPLLVEQAKGLGLGVYSAPRIERNGRAISSTRIRANLIEGKIEKVNELLGYAYFSRGTVESGMGRGARLGFPTLNLSWNPELPPAFGVYAVLASAAATGSGKPFPAVANFGVRPTFCDQSVPILEIHLFEETSLGPGDEIKVLWKSFLRPEKRFSDSEALKSQVSLDKAQAMKFFSDNINTG